MSYKTHKKKELIILIDHLTEQIDQLQNIIIDKDNQINSLLSEIEVLDKPKKVNKKNQYLLKRIKCTIDPDRKQFYLDYYDKINELI